MSPWTPEQTQCGSRISKCFKIWRSRATGSKAKACNGSRRRQILQWECLCSPIQNAVQFGSITQKHPWVMWSTRCILLRRSRVRPKLMVCTLTVLTMSELRMIVGAFQTDLPPTVLGRPLPPSADLWMSSKYHHVYPLAAELDAGLVSGDVLT